MGAALEAPVASSMVVSDLPGYSAFSGARGQSVTRFPPLPSLGLELCVAFSLALWLLYGLCSSIQGRAGAGQAASVSSFSLVCLGLGLPCSTLKLPDGVRIEHTRTRIQGITEGAWDPFGVGGGEEAA